jgi:hypothetical protein
MSWAFAGGVTLDLLLPGRSLGSSALTLVLMTAAALFVARALWPPRLAAIAATALGLTLAYQVMLLGLLAVTSDASFEGLSLTDIALVGLLNMAVATITAMAVRAIDLRFGERERLAW